MTAHPPLRTLIDLVTQAQAGTLCEAALREQEGDWTPSDGINDFVVAEFSTGGCGQFAAALHDVTGWPIYVEAEHGSPDEWAHAYCLNPVGKAVDISGIHASGYAVTKYSDPKLGQGPVRKAERAEIEHDGPGGYYNWATEIIQAFPERFGVKPTRAGIEASFS